MKIQQLIEEQMREFDKKFVVECPTGLNKGKEVLNPMFPEPIKSFLSSYGRKLIEAVGEEITGCKYKINPRMKNRNFYLWQKGYNLSVDDSRLKLKEILSNTK